MVEISDEYEGDVRWQELNEFLKKMGIELDSFREYWGYDDITAILVVAVETAQREVLAKMFPEE